MAAQERKAFFKMIFAPPPQLATLRLLDFAPVSG
jgi:hypothetical protein